MRISHLLKIMGIWLAVSGIMQVAGLARMHSTASAAERRVFDALDFGAVGDDKTDNTEAFSACLLKVIEAGGGRMVLPAGVYQGSILIPAVTKPIASWITIEIVGESEPTSIFGTIGSSPLQNNGTILKCLSATGPAAISATRGADALFGDFSAVNVVIRNLEVRTYDDPGIGGIDLQCALQCKLENVFVNTGVYNVQASKPSHATSGVVTPAINNAAYSVLRNVIVTGYHTGILVNEHTDGDSIVVASNINGLEFAQAHHASHFARVGAYRNSHNITVTGRHGFSIEQLNTERPGQGQTTDLNNWQTCISDINDPESLGVADVNYWVVIGNVGASDVFTCIGAKSIRARRIGSDKTGKDQSED